MVGGGGKFLGAWNFFNRTALRLYYASKSRGRTCVYPPAMVMSDKIKPDPAAPVEPAEQVPEWLGNRLRRMFNDVMDEPVPDEFKALLKQLEEKERGS